MKRSYIGVFSGMLLLYLILFLPLISAQQTEIEDSGITPDSIFWGLDKAFDQINLLLTTGDVDKAKKGLEIAEERLAEIKAMIEENKLEEAEKAQEAHGKALLKVKERVEEVEDDDSLEEIREVIEIEKEVEDHNEKVKQISGELKVKIAIKEEITQEQQDLIDSILKSLEEQTGEVEIEIENKKDKTKIEIEIETGKSEEEIEIEVKNIEKENGIEKEKDALEAINESEEELNKLLEEASRKNATISQDLMNQFNSLLEQAKNEFDLDNYEEAERLAEQAENLLEDQQELEGENEIEVEIEDGKAKVEVGIGDSEWEFELETAELDTIISETSSRTGLSKEEINAIIKVEVEEEETEEE